MSGREEDQNMLLPSIIEVNIAYEGEPGYLVRRKRPCVIRIHKYHKENDSKSYWFSEALLYVPFQTEDEICTKIDDIFFPTFRPEKLENLKRDIHPVKSKVMQYLESVEEARILIEESRMNLE